MAGRIIYAVFARTLWALSLAWMVYACHIGQGGAFIRCSDVVWGWRRD